MSQSQKTARNRQRNERDAARGSNSSAPPPPGRYRARVTANIGAGSYEVTVYDDAGGALLTDFPALAFPLTATSIAVDTYCRVNFKAQSPVAEIEAESIGLAGSGGSSIGGIVSVGSPGFIAST